MQLEFLLASEKFSTFYNSHKDSTFKSQRMKSITLVIATGYKFKVE